MSKRIQYYEFLKLASEGKVFIAEDLIVEPRYSFESFKKSRFYNGQNGVRAIKINEVIDINGEKMIVSLIFREGVIYCVSLINAEFECLAENEIQRKKYHDSILNKLGIILGNYDWGSVSSSYDSKSNISSINIIYK